MYIILGLIIAILLLIIILLLRRDTYTEEKISTILGELNFFKKGKEYSQESMIIFSDTKEVLFANKSARTLLYLPKEDKYQLKEGTLEIEVRNEEREDFFVVLENLYTIRGNTFYLNNVSLIVEDTPISVNISVDMSAWERKKIITCLIVNKVDVSKGILTGLSTQALAIQEINSLLSLSKERETSFGILLLGIDNFKDIQLHLGLTYSYEIIKKMGIYFRKNSYSNVSVYTIDTDKFLFIMKDIVAEDEVRSFGQTLIKSLDSLGKEYKEIHLNISVGIARYPQEGKSTEELLDNVFIALSNSVLESESSIRLFNKENATLRLHELQMSEEIRIGLLQKDFLLYYQPTFDLKWKYIIGVEALLRWKHPKYGIIAADKFIEVAEKTGRIIDLGEYAFAEAISQRSRLKGIVDDSFKISINISLKEIKLEILLPRLKILFAKYKVDRSMISLDISENDTLENIKSTATKLKVLHEFGLSLSLDNFGRKYTSLKSLSILPIDMIKIDRSLIFELTVSKHYKQAVKVIIDMAHTLGYKVVAQGVERRKELEILKELHCDYAQGYLYCKPLNRVDFEALLAK